MQNRAKTIQKRLEGCSRVAVLGIGSDLCGDDAAGVLAVRKLRSMISAQPFTCLEFEGFEGGNSPENTTGFISAFRPTHIVVIDAAAIDLPAGQWREIEREEICEVEFSTHTLPLKVIADYLRYATDADISIIGVRPLTLDFGAQPSPELMTGVKRLCNQLYEVMKECDQILHQVINAAAVHAG